MILKHRFKLFIKRRSDFRLAFLVFIIFFIGSGCSSTKNLESTDDSKVDYSLIFVVHADANYLYHESGEAKKADSEALNESLEIARNTKSGEVFIFHQKPERKAFLFFPKKDRIYYHYKNGLLVNKGKYSPDGGGFAKESEIYKELSQNRKTNRTFFTYFGHEIPTLKGRAYHRSSAKQEFNTEIFANHLQNFSSDIDLAILSTCNNGNPLMLDLLKDFTDIVVASPQNLHLSYLTIEKFQLLESNPKIRTRELADSIAHDSFKRLRSLQTMVTVAVYKSDEISDYISSFNQNYRQHLLSVKKKPLFTNNADCSHIKTLQSSVNTNGIKIFFKPASFGRKAGNSSHSGWGCKD